MSDHLFDDPEVAALMAESQVGQEELRLPGEPRATRDQIQYIRDLLEQLDESNDYDLHTMTVREASEIIDELKESADRQRDDR